MFTSRPWLKWIVGSAAVAGIGLAIVVWAAGDPEPKTAPNLETAPPQEVVRFLASPAMAKMPARERFEYTLKLLTQNNSPEGRKKYIDRLNALSHDQLMTFRNNMIDVVKFMYLNSARQYAQLPDAASRRQFLDRQLDLNDSLNGWVHDVKQNLRSKEVVPLQDMQGQFNLLMDRTTSGERAMLETFLSEAFQRYLARKTQKAFHPDKN